MCWPWRGRRSILFAAIGGTALVAKLVLGGLLLIPRGFDARYFSNAQFAGAMERGTEPADRGFTRTDARLQFGHGDADLPVFFFNDSTRFNFYHPPDPARETLPLSVAWTGWLRIARTGLHRLFVRSEAGTVELSIG